MIKAIIFDLDGTLLYTLEDLHISVNVALQSFGFPIQSLDAIRSNLGNGIRRLVIRSLPENTPTDIADLCFDRFYDHYVIHMDDHTSPYEGILDTLKWLVHHGYRLGVVSNKYDDGVQLLIKKHFSKWIQAAQGESVQFRMKPFPDSTIDIINRLDSTPETTLFVGDSEVDVQTSKASSTHFLGVTWGYRTRQELIQSGAIDLIDQPNQLIEFIIKK